MYQIRRFRKIYCRLFSNNLSDIRKVIGRYEGSLISHILMYIDSDKESNHWSREITRFISSEGVSNLDKSKVKNISYRELFPYYLCNNVSRKKDANKTASDKIRKENNSSILYLIDILDTDLLHDILYEFSNELDHIKSNKGFMITSSDKDRVRLILNNLRDKYKMAD
jgi:hypothetical protein